MLMTKSWTCSSHGLSHHFMLIYAAINDIGEVEKATGPLTDYRRGAEQLRVLVKSTLARASSA